jgi:hypothetical protein
LFPSHDHSVTDDGNILILFKNALAPTSGGGPTDFDNNNPSGVYEYNRDIGIYHKYSPVQTTNTTVTNYGDQRIVEVGAVFYRKPNTSPAEDGSFLYGVKMHTSSDVDDAIFSVVYDDNLETKQKYGHFITSEIPASSIEDTWQKIYVMYKKLLNSGDKIVVKYRTELDTPTEITLDWVSTNRFLTNDDLSSYAEGDEIQVIQGKGGGKSAHIKSIDSHGSGYSVLLDDTFTGATGGSKALVSKWIKAGEIVQGTDENQWKGFTLGKKNTSPFIQIKVGMQFTGKNEIQKLRVINKPHVNE